MWHVRYSLSDKILKTFSIHEIPGAYMICPFCGRETEDTVPECGECGNRHTIRADGVNGQMEMRGRKVKITRKGFLAFLTQGMKGDKEIHASKLSAIQFKKPGKLTNGYLQLSFSGGDESKGGIFNATKDENTVMFTTDQEAEFRAIRDILINLIEHPIPESPSKKADGVGEGAEVAGELERLAELHENGTLTDEEFAAAKRKILGV